MGHATDDELERFLLENPNSLAGERADVWAVWARQVAAPGTANSIFRGLRTDLSTPIVECKLAA